VRSWLGTLRLTDFRSYDRAELRTDGRSVYLFGPNGAGKTNRLEAISFLSPGRGLRGAALSEVGRRAPGESAGRAWAISVDVEGEHGSVRLGAGVESGTASRRIVRVDGETVASGVLTQHTRPIWLTPAPSRLFLEGSGERRRFFDRLVFAAAPDHAANVALYDRALRERTKLLADPPADPDWLTALESSMASAGARAASARARTLEDLQSEIDARGDRDFPSANLGLAGEWERLALAGVEAAEIEARLASALARARGRDAAAGRALTGPHRGDLVVVHRGKDRVAGECSTGEQKALILNLVLAHAARLSRSKTQPNPVLLFDEVAAHLDPLRRAALFDEIEALSLQAFLTGTDALLFETLKGRAIGVHVDASTLTALDS
jgi:DNA replication and repair protein RecF